MEEMRSLYLVVGVAGVEFDQVLDHSLPELNRTFKQRYFVNDKYYQEGGAGFLYVGGESAFWEGSIRSGLVAELAEENRGVVYGLEHRYYGKSHPFNNVSVASLKYLSSDQALGDLAHFALNVVGHSPKKWFLIGGSYAGTLAAWARQKYPHVFHGALASSAPLEAKADFSGYDEMVAKVLGKKCSSTVNRIMAYLDKLYEMGRLEEVKESLNCTKVKDDLHFLSTIASAAAGIVQYNGIISPTTNHLCKHISFTGTIHEILARFQEMLIAYFNYHNKTCFDFSYQKQLSSINHSETSNFRQWIYQACQEFGFWQTASKIPMRSKYLTLDWYNNFLCHSNFFTSAIGPPKTDLINTKHHGKDINSSNILFTHGEKDPWFKLSYTKQNSIVIQNASHTNDLISSANSNPILDARQSIRQTFRKWIHS